MMEKVNLSWNEPQELALQKAGPGKLMPSQFEKDEVMFRLNDGRVIFLPVDQRGVIEDLNLRANQNFGIVKRQIKSGNQRGVRFEAEISGGGQPNPNAEISATAKASPAPTQGDGSPRTQHSNGAVPPEQIEDAIRRGMASGKPNEELLQEVTREISLLLAGPTTGKNGHTRTQEQVLADKLAGLREKIVTSPDGTVHTYNGAPAPNGHTNGGPRLVEKETTGAQPQPPEIKQQLSEAEIEAQIALRGSQALSAGKTAIAVCAELEKFADGVKYPVRFEAQHVYGIWATILIGKQRENGGYR